MVDLPCKIRIILLCRFEHNLAPISLYSAESLSVVYFGAIGELVGREIDFAK